MASIIEKLYKNSRLNKNVGIHRYAPNKIGWTDSVLVNSETIQFDKNNKTVRINEKNTIWSIQTCIVG